MSGENNHGAASQQKLAEQCYQNLRAALPVTPGEDTKDQLLLTGHSMGGGLAGFIAGLYGSYGTIFDNVRFDLSLDNFKKDEQAGLNDNHAMVRAAA